jgi:hypothetical protein
MGSAGSVHCSHEDAATWQARSGDLLARERRWMIRREMDFVWKVFYGEAFGGG